MLQGEFRTLVALWQEAEKTQKNVPSRSTFDPMRLRGLLSQVHILEFNGPHRLIYRLSGTTEVWRLNQDPKGQNYFELVNEKASDFLRKNMHNILFHPCGLLITTQEVYSDGNSRPTEFLALPLYDENRNSDQVIALVSASQRININLMTEFRKSEKPWYDYVEKIEPYDIGYGTPKEQYLADT